MFENSINETTSKPNTKQKQSKSTQQYQQIKKRQNGNTPDTQQIQLSPLEQKYQRWKVIHQLAIQGSYQAIQQIKTYLIPKENQQQLLYKQLQLEKYNFYDILQKSNIRLLRKRQTWGSYQLFSKVPMIFLLQGSISLSCINLQADNQIISSIKQRGPLYLQKQKLQKKYGQSNLNLLTQFQIVANQDSIFIELKSPLKPNRIVQLSQKQKAINNNFLFYPTKQITKIRVKGENNKINQKFYLLSGKICYYMEPLVQSVNQQQQKQKKSLTSIKTINNKGKQKSNIATNKNNSKNTINRPLILAAYNQGYFNPNQFLNTIYQDIFKILIFDDAQIMIFQEQFLRNQVIAGLQSKRQQHLISVKKSYQEIYQNKIKKAQIVINKQINQIQDKLIQKYRLSRKKIDKIIYNISSQKQTNRAGTSLMKTTGTHYGINSSTSTKDQMIVTSSSLKKQRCAIRIKKTVKKK